MLIVLLTNDRKLVESQEEGADGAQRRQPPEHVDDARSSWISWSVTT